MSDGTLDKVRRFIAANRLLQAGDRVIVALSGGADSVALLHILNSLKEEYELTLSAAHFHHGIRGDEADCDEAFVTALCEQWDIPLFCGRADVPAIAACSGESEELCGRRLRYRFLEDTAREVGGALIATAHHRDDHAETVLWNLTRGSGIGGLCGIPVRRENIIRPLLCCSRGEIEAYDREHQLHYAEDSTNAQDVYTRNRLRHQVMPLLRELNPAADAHIARTAELMREADEYLEQISQLELNKAKAPFGYSCEKLLELPAAVLKYAVKNLLENAGAPVDFRHITLIIEAMRLGGAVELGRGYTAVCAQGVLRVIAPTAPGDEYCIPLTAYLADHGRRLILRDGRVCDPLQPDESGQKINNLLLNQCIRCDIITPDTVVRYRRAGDTFTDACRGHTKTIKKLMNEMKIPRELRDTIPLIANGSTVLWMQGVGAAAQARASDAYDGELIWIDEIIR